MPGINVREDGTVLYQNRPINKFYIENLDMLQGRYGIATNNISAKDVASVQVMENHQPIRALIGKEFVNEAALNLKLKESAKGAFFLHAQAGVGMQPLLWSNKLQAMYFTRNLQHLSMYKGDNTGHDITHEQQLLYNTAQATINLPELLHIIAPSTPKIPQQRYLFNHSHLGTVNNLNKIGKYYTLTTNLNYLYDKIEKEGYNVTQYFLPNHEMVSIEEMMNAHIRKNQFDAALNLNANTESFYLNNDVKFSVSSRKDAGTILSNSKNTQQRLHTPNYTISNFLDIAKTKGNKIYKAQSFFGYKNVEQSLWVSPLVINPVASQIETVKSVTQHVNLKDFETRNKLSWGTSGRFSMDYSVELNAALQTLHSDFNSIVNGYAQTSDSLQNNHSRNYIEGIFSVGTGYDITQTMNIRLTIPTRYLILKHGDKEKTNDTFFFVEPFAMVNWQISSRWSSNALYGLTHSTGGIDKAYNHPILLNYRLLMHHDDKIEESINQNFISSLQYKNPFSTFFGSLNLFYNNNRKNLIYEYRYNDIFTTRTSVEQPNTDENFMASINIGKEVEGLRSNLSFGASYMQFRAKQISQSQLVNFKSHTLSFSPRIITKIGTFAKIHYRATYSNMYSHLDMVTKRLPHINTLSQNINLHIFPTEKTAISLRCDHIRLSVNNRNQMMWFGDIEMRYKLKNADVILDCNNIFNTRQFMNSSYSDVGSYYSEYQLRPSEVLLRVLFKIF